MFNEAENNNNAKAMHQDQFFYEFSHYMALFLEGKVISERALKQFSGDL